MGKVKKRLRPEDIIINCSEWVFCLFVYLVYGLNLDNHYNKYSRSYCHYDIIYKSLLGHKTDINYCKNVF